LKTGQCSFSELSFPKLFNTYVTNFNLLSDFYDCNPHDQDAIVTKARNLSSVVDDNFLSALQAYHRSLNLSETQAANLERLSKGDDVLTIVTGQQFGLFGGPLFTIYKTLTAIKLAKEYSEKLSRPVIPVFWLADEDHDFEEIAWFAAPGDNERRLFQLKDDETNQPVGSIEIGSELDNVKSVIKDELTDTDFSDALWEFVNNCYQDGKTHVFAFAQLMDRLFSKHGLVLCGSNFKPLKEIAKPVLKRSVTDIKKHISCLEDQTEKITQNFHQQVTLGSSNLFYLHPQKGRIKIDEESGIWSVDKVGRYSRNELLELIDTHPERFSPNVFLRPVFQDYLLPTLAYVAGPGEVAYYGQMKTFYHQFDMNMPVIYPRLSGSLIESGIERIMEKLPFGFCEYAKRIEDLESEYVDKTEKHDIEAIFKHWKNRVNEISKHPVSEIAEIEPTLENAADKVTAVFGNELDRLKGKVYRSVKQQEQTQLKRIRKIKSQLFPDGGLQERSISYLYFMNKYGLDIWDLLLEEISKKNLSTEKHHLFYL